MTFTEAAVEVLRRSGNPLHYKQIAQEAITAGLLSHVGQTPEETMGARLLAMAGSEQDRAVLAVDTGTFGLVEWGLPTATPILEVPATSVEEERPYRNRERHPPLGEEMAPGGRREERRRARDEDDGRRKKKYAPPSEVAHAWLRDHGQPATLEAIAKALREKDRIAEALERDLGSLEKALREENRRREGLRRTPLFEFLADGTVRGLELTREPQQPRRGERPQVEARPQPVREEVRPVAFDEQRRLVLRTVRRRVSSLDLSALERLAVALLEAQGFRELQLARRTKEGPIYLARRKWGASEWRFVVRVLKPGRDLGRPEVQELRKDLGHYSAQTGMVFGAAECSREAKSEANSVGSAPVMLYGAEAFAEALVEAGLGARKRMVEWFDYDESFFASIGAGEELPEAAELSEPAGTESISAAPEPTPERHEPPEKSRRARDRERRRERRKEGEPAPVENASAESASAESASAESASAESGSVESGSVDTVEVIDTPSLPEGSAAGEVVEAGSDEAAPTFATEQVTSPSEDVSDAIAPALSSTAEPDASGDVS